MPFYQKQVEHHIRRLATPLLLRAGERARLHKEAPETLRFGFRRASKGYGVRVSRQCVISSGVAAAWAAVAGAAVPVAVETEATRGTGLRAVASSAGLGGSPATTAPSVRVEHEQEPEQQQQQQRQQNHHHHYHQQLLQQQQEKNNGEAGEALSEMVRLAMVMFDNMVSPTEALDLTLLSVGLAGFRGLGGGAQSGMARWVEQAPSSGRVASIGVWSSPPPSSFVG